MSPHIQARLDDQTRLRLKLTNPLGVAELIISQAQAAGAAQDEALGEDTETVAVLEGGLATHAKELGSDLGPRLAEVGNILARLQERGLDFFDSTLRLTNILNSGIFAAAAGALHRAPGSAGRAPACLL